MTYVALDAERHEKIWHPDGGDSHPPPGYDLASEINKELAKIYSTFPIGNDSWEHNYWFMHFKADNRNYFLRLEPSFDDAEKYLYLLSIDAERNLWETVTRKFIQAAPQVLESVLKIVKAVAMVRGAGWSENEGEYDRLLIGNIEKQKEKNEAEAEEKRRYWKSKLGGSGA